jgi:malonyl-CoA decarboxylase
MNIIGRFAKNLRDSIADAGEKFLDIKISRDAPVNRLIDLCHDLVSIKGVASGMALAREVVKQYKELETEDKLGFFIRLKDEFAPNMQQISKSAQHFIEKQNDNTLRKLAVSIRSSRLELFNRMNMAPNGTLAIVSLREDLLGFLPDHPELKPVDNDLKQLLTSWFNPGFLVLTRIDWDTEASILEKIIEYEAVHNIENWTDLKQRLVASRRCFAYFHPALEDEPLIFVEVALTKGISSSIQQIITEENGDSMEADTAIFYSINNCQKGLKQIPLGNFLIKRVVDELARELPWIKTYSSLSPVTGFSSWLMKCLSNGSDEFFTIEEREQLSMLNDPIWDTEPEKIKKLKKPLMHACAVYLVNAKRKEMPLNPVSRFHFGNGASLYRINWMGNTSKHGIEDSFGIMVNYLYDLRDIEANHEAYVTKGELSYSKSVRNLLANRSK